MDDRKWLIAVLVGLLLAVGFVYFPWGDGRRGAPKYPVTGTVFVNGEPAGGVQVRFFAADTSLVPQDQMPVAVTDVEGRFEMSSFGGGDGSAEGRYGVAFFWPTNILNPTTDRFRGRFSDPAANAFVAEVRPEPTEIPSFEITVDPEQLLPMELSLADVAAATQEAGQ